VKTGKEIYFSESYRIFKMTLADLFSSGHTFSEIMNMGYLDEYLFIVDCMHERRLAEHGQGGSRELRPVQRDAIKKAKNLKK
jgi:hypothetical protein